MGRLAPVLVVALVACGGGDAQPSVRYVSVKAQPVTDSMGHHELSVVIELEVTSPMPNVAPSVKVLADCGGKTDDDDAFFNDLSNARPGERKVDESKLFGMEGLAGPPERCEITLSLERGATPPQRFCYRSGETTPGACK